MPDTKAPVLKRLVLPASIDLSNEDRSFRVLAEAEDGEGGSGIAYVSVWFDRKVDFQRGPDYLLQFGYDGSEDSFADATPTVGSAMTVLMPSTPIGTYHIESVWLTDVAGNIAKYDEKALQALGIRTTMDVTGRPADTTPPILESLTFPAMIDLSRGDAGMTFTVEASDDAGGAGLESIVVRLAQPLLTDGYRTSSLYISNVYASDPEHVESTFEIGQAAMAGNYDITEVIVKDRAGNEQRYGADQLTQMGIATQFNVSGAVTDIGRPELIDMWLPRTVSLESLAPQSFAVMAQDRGGRGVKTVIATLDRPITLSDGSVDWLSVGHWPGDTFEDGTPGVATQHFRFTDATAPGTYNVVSLTVWDQAGNYMAYSAAELRALGINTAMTVVDAAPTATATPAHIDGNLVVALSAQGWKAAGADNVALTLNIDQAALRFVGVSVEGAPGAAFNTSVQYLSGSRIAVSGSGALPADAVVKLIFEPLAGAASYRYAIESLRVNGQAQTLASGNMETVRFGTSGDDAIDGTLGGFIDAGAGRDEVRFDGVAGEYTILRSGSGFVIDHRGERVSVAGVERLAFADASVALDLDGVGGQAYRLYQAAFGRAPDEGGIGFWIGQMDAGVPLGSVARDFLSSAEFEKKYGVEPSSEDFLAALYRNVLHRAPDPDGFAFWMKALQANVERADVLVHFSESTENVAQVLPAIDNGFAFWPAY